MSYARFGVILGMLLVLALPTVSGYELVGNYVIEDNAKATITAYPHTVSGPWEPISIMIKSKIYEGPIDVMFGFDSDVALPKSGEYLKNGTWIDVSDKFTAVSKDYQGFDRWYYFREFDVVAGEEYYVRMTLKFTALGNGKYWTCIKPSGDTLQEAIQSGRFMCLDPWFNASYINRRQINTTCLTCVANASFMMPVNRTGRIDINGSLELFWCNMTSNETESFVYYNSQTDYICADGTQRTLIVDEGNGSQFQSLESSIVTWLDLGSNNCNATHCTDKSIYGKTYDKKGANEPITNSSGQIGSAQEFDGTDDDIELDEDAFWNSAFPDNCPIYISAWVRPQDASVISYPIQRNGHFFLTIDTNGKPLFTYWFNASDRAPFSGSNGDITFNAWNFIEFSHTGTGNQGTVYVNGVNVTVSQTTSINSKVTTDPMQLGAFLANFDDELIDMVIMMNSTPSDDERRFLYEMMSVAGDLGAEENISSSITILSPTTTTYTNSSVALLYSYDSSDGSTCVSSLFNINNGANTSLSCLNSTIVFDDIFGTSQTVTVFVTNNNGSVTSKSASYTVLFANFTVNVFDEMDGSPLNFSESVNTTQSMVLTGFCVNDTQTQDLLSNSTAEVQFTCDVISLKLVVTDNASAVNERLLRPTTTNQIMKFYMINTTKDTEKRQTWRIYDVTGLYQNGIVQLQKIIPDIGTVTITQETIDAEDKVVLDLIVGELYIVSIFDSDGGNERSIGIIEASTDDAINLQVSNIPFATEGREPARDVFITWFWDTKMAAIRAVYNDTLAETISVNFTLYNASNVSIMENFTRLSTSDVVTFFFRNVNTNTSYIAYITAQHERYGEIVDSVNIIFGDTGQYKVQGLEDLDLGIWMSVAGGMIALFVGLSFGRRSSKIGSAVTVLIIVMFMSFGWFSDSPQLGWSMIIMVAFIAFIGVLSLRRRFN